MIEAINQHPDWNDVRVADSIPCSRSWVQEVRAGLVPVYVEPKLLNHGGKREGQGSNGNLGRGKEYTIARLIRDGNQDLADQVKG